MDASSARNHPCARHRSQQANRTRLSRDRELTAQRSADLLKHCSYATVDRLTSVSSLLKREERRHKSTITVRGSTNERAPIHADGTLSACVGDLLFVISNFRLSKSGSGPGSKGRVQRTCAAPCVGGYSVCEASRYPAARVGS